MTVQSMTKLEVTCSKRSLADSNDLLKLTGSQPYAHCICRFSCCCVVSCCHSTHTACCCVERPWQFEPLQTSHSTHCSRCFHRAGSRCDSSTVLHAQQHHLCQADAGNNPGLAPCTTTKATPRRAAGPIAVNSSINSSPEATARGQSWDGEVCLRHHPQPL
jgi:hypothetical protein